MTNPLNRNKVIRFIRDYPHESSFSLINSDKSIIVRPGDPGETGTNSGDIIPDSNIPGCSVGLAGAEGNPDDFNTIIDWWLDPDQRYKLNPLALMRLWASIYRTYFGFIKRTNRLYPTSNSQLAVRKVRIDPAKDYSVRFEDGLGNVSTWDPNSQQYSSGFIEGLSRRFEDGGVLGVIYNVQNVIGTYDQEVSNRDYTGDMYFGEVVNTYYNKDFQLKGILGGVCFYAIDTTTGVQTNIPELAISATTSSVQTRTYINTTSGRRLKIFDKMQAPYNLITKASVGSYKLTITFNTPTAINNIYPCNLEARNYAFILKTSIDGATYDESINYGDYNNTVLNTVYYPWDNRTVVKEYQTEVYVKNVKNIDNNIYSTPPVYRSWGYEKTLDEFFADNNPDLYFNATVKTQTINDASYTNISLAEGDLIIGHKPVVYTATKDGATVNLELRAYHTYATKYYSTNFPTFEGLTPLTKDGTWTLTDKTTNIVVQEGTYSYNIFDPNRYVKSIEITFGPRNAEAQTTDFWGYSHPIIDGFTNKNTASNQSGFKSYNEVDFTNDYYTNTNPENYSIGSTNIIDDLAKTSFQSKTYSNNFKWKLLPYVLPFNKPTLRGSLNKISSVFQGLETDFEYTEDYLDHKLLRLPNDEAELNEHITLSKQLNRTPHIYWYNLRVNELLNELINHCKNTCLKFWRLNYTYSVSNYNDYSELVLDVQPETRDIRKVGGTRINYSGGIENNSIQTFVIAEANVDIEKSISPGELWFLSGGGYTSVDLASNILSEYIDNLLAEGAEGNTNRNPNIIR